MGCIRRRQIGEGIHFTSVAEPMFKQNHLSVNFMLPLRRDTAAVNALLPMVLKRGCREYPDMTLLNAKLKDLYGARLDGGVVKRGEIQIVSLFTEQIRDSYALGGEKVLSECASLLKSVIFSPALENGLFRENDLEIERRNLADLIDSQINDKRTYANQRLKEEMCRDEAYGAGEYGTHGQAMRVTSRELLDAWNRMIRSAEVEILFLGDGDSEACEKLFSDAFASAGRGEIIRCETQVVRTASEPKTFREVLPVAQAKLVMGFRAGTATPEPGVPAMQLACTVFGGSPHSKLFLNVREKMSLCYYCYSRFERQKGLMFVDSGIETSHFEKARDEILRQLAAVQKGDFTDDELSTAALSLRNSYRELSDSLGDLSSWYLGQAVAGTMQTPCEAADEVMSLGREDTVYLLCGGEKEDVADERL